MNIVSFLKKNIATIIWVGVLALLIFSPDAKAFILKGLLKTGIFNAGTKKETISDDVINNPIYFLSKEGIKVGTGDLKGKVVFINFWATWCPPCIAEMPSINALYNQLKNDPHIVFIIADADNDFLTSGRFMAKYGYSLPLYLLTSAIPEKIYSGTLPTTVIINSKGEIVQRHEGIANYDTKEMIDFLRSL